MHLKGNEVINCDAQVKSLQEMRNRAVKGFGAKIEVKSIGNWFTIN